MCAMKYSEWCVMPSQYDIYLLTFLVPFNREINLQIYYVTFGLGLV